MAAANSKRFLCGFLKLKLWFILIYIFVLTLILAVAYMCIKCGELLRFCEEQTAESVAPSWLVEILQRVLRWSGIQSHEHNDSTTRASALCSSGNWFHIMYIVFTKFLPEDCGELILFLLTIFETKFRLLYNCSKTFLGTTVPWLFTKYPLVLIATCIIIISIFSILIIMRKLRIHRQNHNIVAHSQHSSNSLMHLSPFHYNDSVNAIRSSLAERNVSVPSHQFHPQQINNWGLAFFLHWMFVVLVLSLILSIPWEFLRLYHKARASRAADVLKGLPPECTQTSMTWLQTIQYVLRWHFSWSLNHNVCQDYYYASMVDPLWEVNPLLVLSSVFTKGILHSLEIGSSSLGRSLRAFFSEIPSQWQPLIMIFAVAIFLVILMMVFRYRLSIPLVLRIEPRTPVHSPAQQYKESKDKSSHQFENKIRHDCLNGIRPVNYDDDNEIDHCSSTSIHQRQVMHPSENVSFGSNLNNSNSNSSLHKGFKTTRRATNRLNEATRSISSDNEYDIPSRKTYFDEDNHDNVKDTPTGTRKRSTRDNSKLKLDKSKSKPRGTKISKNK